MLKSIIIDDELQSIKGLMWELKNFSNEITVEETFTDATLAIAFLNEHTDIDVVFLDIEMPKMNGLNFMDHFSERDFHIIITTAYSEYAISALKKNTFDYLLKPIDEEDLGVAISKLKEKKKTSSIDTQLEELLINLQAPVSRKKIMFNTSGKMLFVDPEKIIYIESKGNYSDIVLDEGPNILMSKKIKDIEAMLPQNIFFRLHNSYIVNLQRVTEYFKTECYVVLDNNTKIPVSRSRKVDFLDQF